MLHRAIRKVRRLFVDAQARRLAAGYSIPGGYRRIYLYHIRKTAGTSLCAAFWGLAGLDLQQFGRRSIMCRRGFAFVRNDRRLVEAGSYFFATSHYAAHALSLPPDTFTITILRDPLQRLLSHYRYLRWAHEDPEARFREPFLPELQQEIGWLGNSFGDFLDHVPPASLLRQLFMFSESFDLGEAVERICACSAVCFTEHFGQDLEVLAQRLDLPLRIKHERRFGLTIDPSPEEIERARKLVMPEAELINRVAARCTGTVMSCS